MKQKTTNLHFILPPIKFYLFGKLLILQFYMFYFNFILYFILFYFSTVPPKERKTKEQIAAAAAASGRSKKKVKTKQNSYIINVIYKNMYNA